METTGTHLSETIDSLQSLKARYDQNIKEILADRQVLARILKYTMEEYATYTIEEIISCISDDIEVAAVPLDPGLSNLGKVKETANEDIVINEGTIVYDIRFRAYLGKEPIVILINIEAQGITNAGTLKYHLENRIVYYLSRMVSAQKNTEFFGEDYDSIKRVRSIWICMDAAQNDDSINELRLVGKNIYGKKENFENLDLIRAVVVSIRKSENVEESKNQLIAMLEELLSGKDVNVKKENLKNKYGMVMSVEMERRVSGMCNFSDVLVYDAEERGIERGRKEGEERGRREGMAKEIVEMGQEFNLDDAAILKRLQEKAGLTLEEATACLEKYRQVLA